MCTRVSAQRALSILICAVTPPFRALEGSAVNGYPESQLRRVGGANTGGGGPHALPMESQQWRIRRSSRLVDEPELQELDAKLEAIEALGLVVAGEANALSRPECIVDGRTPHEAGIDTAMSWMLRPGALDVASRRLVI